MFVSYKRTNPLSVTRGNGTRPVVPVAPSVGEVDYRTHGATARYGSEIRGGTGRVRTGDLRIMSPLLFRLSYGSMLARRGGFEPPGPGFGDRRLNRLATAALMRHDRCVTGAVRDLPCTSARFRRLAVPCYRSGNPVCFRGSRRSFKNRNSGGAAKSSVSAWDSRNLIPRGCRGS